MTDNKINKQTMTEDELNQLSVKIVSRMMNIQTMSEWYEHVSSSDIAWGVAYQDLDLDEEVEALGEAAKLMTIMEICKEDEQYEKCAIIKNRMEEVNRILRKGKR